MQIDSRGLVTLLGFHAAGFWRRVMGRKMAIAVPTRIERRCAQRFSEYQVSVVLRTLDGQTGTAFTLDLSSRGALLWTDFELRADQLVDMTLVMPSEITLTEEMSVRCRARVLRSQRDGDRGKLALAVRIEHYDYLPRELTPLQQHALAGTQVFRP
jgi:hypothetical protein